MNGATGATGIVGMLLDTADQAMELVAPDSNKIRVYADTTSSGDGFKLLPGSTSGAGGLIIANGATGINPTEFVFYNSTVSGGGLSAGQLALYGYSAGSDALILDAQANGSAIILGSSGVVDGAIVSINGTKGGVAQTSRVNDPIYNPSVSNTGFSFTAGPALSGDGVYSGSDITLDPGLYLFQVELGLNNGGSFNIPSPGSLVFYLADVAGGGFRPFSEMNITNTMIASPGVGTANEPTFSSAVITITTTTACSVAYEIDGSWDLGTGKQAKFQIIKLA
jgi:hypothetical protein